MVVSYCRFWGVVVVEVVAEGESVRRRTPFCWLVDMRVAIVLNSLAIELDCW